MTSGVSIQMPLPARAVKPGEAVPQPRAGKDSGGREAQTTAADSKATSAAVRREVSRLNEYLREMRRDLAFRVDEGSGRVVITVTNPVTQEVIRQIPPERLLELAENFELGGLFLKDRA
ncbi:MAG: flagellar protein FlaG [Nitrococcus sp.]|nr:flagellar protein FlaG [Nitrococcus sp.]